MENKYKLIFPDEIEFFICDEILKEIPKFQKIFAENGSHELHIKDIDGKIFSHILTFIKYNISHPNDKEMLTGMIKNMDFETVTDFLLVSNNLELFQIKDTIKIYLNDIIYKNQIEKIRKIFNIEDDN